MDDGIKNIKELLSERNFTTYMFDKHATGIIENIKDRTLGAFGKVL